MASENLPISLLRLGASFIAFGILFGLVVGIAPYPRLALTAHIQFNVQGMATVLSGLVLNTSFATRSGASPVTSSSYRTLSSTLSPWQASWIYYSSLSNIITLSAEVINAWWGTRQVLPIAAEQAGVMTDAVQWKETYMTLAHVLPALAIAGIWPIILWKLGEVSGGEGRQEDKKQTKRA